MISWGSLTGQNSLVKTDTLTVKDNSLILSQRNLVPFSEEVRLYGAIIPEAQYSINYDKGNITFVKNAIYPNDTVIVVYRYFTRNPMDTIALKQAKIIRDSLDEPQLIVGDTYFKWEEFKEENKLRKSGSVTRGITVGNATGTAVTSGMRLQLEGDLGDGLQIVGAITDDNIPVQPDGSTQQISDFDKVFIQLKKNGASVTVGDYEIQQKGSRFTDLYRNVQGVKIGYEGKKNKGFVSGAVAKGKFHSNSISGLDGVSGPYRLTGKSGEQFFTVLAGSEKVYLNGKLLVRGENYDYVIDYNTAQLTFTARNVITNISRIVVDFEYTDRYFNRSLIFAEGEQKLLNDRISLRITYSRDADNPNAPFDDKAAYFSVKDSLALYGDTPDGVVYTSGIIKDSAFNRLQAFYYRNDTLINGINYERYIHTTDSLQAKYKIYFSYTGPGKGFYKRDASGFNQYVFEWSPPDINGNPTGDYSPVKPWILPKLLQVAGLQSSFDITPKMKFYAEQAYSINDQNRLSSLSDEDNGAIASLTGLKWDKVALKDSVFFSADLSHSLVQEKYQNLDRIYKAEYGRIWNFNDLSDKRYNENIFMAKTQWEWKRKLKINTENGVRLTGEGRTAIRQVYAITSSMKKAIQGNYTFTHIIAREDNLKRLSYWQRHEGDVFYQKPLWKAGTEIWIENKKENIADSVAVGTFQFWDIKPYFRTPDDKKLQMDISLNYRYDKEFYQSLFRNKSSATTQFYKIIYAPSEHFRIQNITTFRSLNLLDTTFRKTGLNDNRVVNTNLQLTGSSTNRMIYANLIYEITSEQIAQRDIKFLRVNPGQGEYQWIDYNQDNIQSINEFVISNNPLTADFIRTVLPTQRFVPTTRPALQGNIRLDFKKIYPKSKNPWKETLRNFKSFTNVRITQSKERENSLSAYLVRFNESPSDTALIDMSYNFRQEFLFFQNSTTGDFKFAYQNNRTKQFLSTGAETRAARFWTLAQRLSVGSDKSLELETGFGKRFSYARNFPTRNYDVRYIETYPHINWQASRKLRFTAGYQYKYKKNINDSSFVNSRVSYHKLTAENRWNLKERNNLNVKLDLIGIRQRNTGDGPNFTANYELLESLNPGINAVWQVFLTYYIFKDMELGITYEGRAPASAPVIHTGRVQIRALF
ncbi:MAG: hypothetical protein K1X92_08730 [Bacteroidia bacterium]|nr:hypothetical protein [Bacteroidia bacterium]